MEEGDVMKLSDVRWVAIDGDSRRSAYGYEDKPQHDPTDKYWQVDSGELRGLRGDELPTLGYTKADAEPKDSLERVNYVTPEIMEVANVANAPEVATQDVAPLEIATSSGPFVKHDAGKVRYTLLPPWALRWVAQVLTHGAKKYAADNWRKAFEPNFEAGRDRYMDAAYRHMEAVRRGEWIDEDSGLPHLACAIASLMFVLEAGG